MDDPLDALDQMASMPGDADPRPRATESYDDAASRVNRIAQQQYSAQKQWGRMKAEDLTQRGVAYTQTPSGNVSEVTDWTGAPLTNADKANKIAYNSSGNPVDYSADSTGRPKMTDPFEGVPTTTDQKTGDQYQIRPGLPWKWTGQDPEIAQAAQQAQQEKINQQTASALAPEEANARRNALLLNGRAKMSVKSTGAALSGLGVPLTDQTGQPIDLQNADIPSLKAHISESFNSAYSTPEANARPIFGGGQYTNEAAALRKSIDDRKQQAMELADAHGAALQNAADAHDAYSQIQQQRLTLQSGRLDAVNQRRVAAGMEPVTVPQIPGLDTPSASSASGAQRDSATGDLVPHVSGGGAEDALPTQGVPGASESHNLAEAGATPAPATASPQPFAPTDTPFRAEQDGTVSFDPSRLTQGLTAAHQAGAIDEDKYNSLLPKAAAAEHAYAEQQKMLANSTIASKLKALGHGATTGAAFLAGAPIGAEVGAGIGAFGGPLDPVTVPLGAAIGGAITGGVASWGAGKILKKLGEYSDTIQSFNDAAEAHPNFDAAGNLISFAAGLPKAGTNLAAKGLSALAGEGEGAVAKGLRTAASGFEKGSPGLASSVSNLAEESANRAAQGASLGARASAIASRVGGYAGVNVALDTAIKEGSKALGLSDEGQTLPGAAQAAIIGAIMSGHGITFENVPNSGVADIMARGKIREDAGLSRRDEMNAADIASKYPNADGVTVHALSRPLSDKETEIYNAASAQIKAALNRGETLGEGTTVTAKQALTGGQPYGNTSAVVTPGSEPATASPRESTSGNPPRLQTPEQSQPTSPGLPAAPSPASEAPHSPASENSAPALGGNQQQSSGANSYPVVTPNPGGGQAGSPQQPAPAQDEKAPTIPEHLRIPGIDPEPTAASTAGETPTQPTPTGQQAPAIPGLREPGEATVRDGSAQGEQTPAVTGEQPLSESKDVPLTTADAQPPESKQKPSSETISSLEQKVADAMALQEQAKREGNALAVALHGKEAADAQNQLNVLKAQGEQPSGANTAKSDTRIEQLYDEQEKLARELKGEKSLAAIRDEELRDGMVEKDPQLQSELMENYDAYDESLKSRKDEIDRKEQQFAKNAIELYTLTRGPIEDAASSGAVSGHGYTNKYLDEAVSRAKLRASKQPESVASAPAQTSSVPEIPGLNSPEAPPSEQRVATTGGKDTTGGTAAASSGLVESKAPEIPGVKPEASLSAPARKVHDIAKAVLKLHADALKSLGHPQELEIGETRAGSGLETDVEKERIRIDPEKLAKATSGMKPQQQLKFVKRAVAEEVIHVATVKYAKESQGQKDKLLSLTGDKELMEQTRTAYGPEFDGLNDFAKASEAARLLVQGPGKVTEASHKWLKDFLKWLTTKLKNLPQDARDVVEGIRKKLGQYESSPKAEVASPVEPKARTEVEAEKGRPSEAVSTPKEAASVKAEIGRAFQPKNYRIIPAKREGDRLKVEGQYEDGKWQTAITTSNDADWARQWIKSRDGVVATDPAEQIQKIVADAGERKAAEKLANAPDTSPAKMKVQKEYLLDALDKAIEDAAEDRAPAWRTDEAKADSKTLSDVQRYDSPLQKEKPHLDYGASAEAKTEHETRMKEWEAKVTDELRPLFEKYGIPETSEAQPPFIGMDGMTVLQPAGPLSVEQRENLLEVAIKNKDREAAPKIRIEVPGDGEFTLINNKESLTAFRKIAEKQFPTKTAAAKKPTGSAPMSTKGRAIPPIGNPKAAGQFIKIAAVAMSDDPTRPVLNGVLSDGKNIVATDGRRIMRLDAKAGGSEKKPVLFNPKTLKAIKAEDKYPNWRQVIPQESGHKFEVDTASALKLLYQASQMTSERSNSVKISFSKDGALAMESNVPDVGSYEGGEQSGKPAFIAGFNPEFLIDGLEAARALGHEKVSLEGTDERSPLALRAKGFEYVLMPMRLSAANPQLGAANPVEQRELEQPKGNAHEPAATEIRNPGVVEPPPQTIRGKETGGSKPVRSEMLGGTGGQKSDAAQEAGRAGQLLSGVEAHQLHTEPPGQVPGVSRMVQEMGRASGERASGEDLMQQAEKAGLILPMDTIKGLIRGDVLTVQRVQERLKSIEPGEHLGAANPFRAAYDKAMDVVGQVKDEIKGAPARDKIVAGYDAASNIANNKGEQAANSIRLDLPAAKDREAMPFVIEAGGDKNKLQIEKAKVAASSDPKLAKEYGPVIDHAIAEFSRLNDARTNHDKMMAESLAELKKEGVDVGEVENYVTRKLDQPENAKEVLPNPLFSMGSGHGSNPRYFTKGRAFETLGDAIKAGYPPKSTDLADLDGHRIEAAQRIIETKHYIDGLKATKSPTDLKPIIGEMEKRTALSGKEEPVVPKGYTVVPVVGRPLVVHEQFADTFRNLFGHSAIRSNVAGRALLKFAAVSKGYTLVFDTFHVGRILFKMATAGGGAPVTMRDGKPAWNIHKGLSLLEYSEADLQRAVDAKMVTKTEAAYARTQRPKVDELMKAGLNVGRIADNLQEQAGVHLPIVGTLNSWIFGKLCRGAMLQTALKAYDRNLSKPGVTREAAARQTAKEMNELFGNLQNQGLFTSKTLQDVARLTFLAPNWTQSQAKYEARAYGQAAKSAFNFVRSKGQDRSIGNSTRAMVAGFVALLAVNQVINMLTRGKTTLQNPEEGHKLDAWLPGGKYGFWFNPSEIAAEYFHAATKYFAQHENAVDIATHIASNKLSPLARGVKEAATGRDYAGRHFLSNEDRFRAAIIDALPSPLPLGAVLEKDPRQPLGYRLNRQPGSMEKQVLQSIGAKTAGGQSPRTQMFAIAQPYRSDRQGSDNAGEYTELRRALDNDNASASKSEIQWLLQRGKSMEQIGRAVGLQKNGSIRPELFAGSTDREADMLGHLTPAQKEIYQQAQRDHLANAIKFQQFSRGISAPLTAKATQPHRPASRLFSVDAF